MDNYTPQQLEQIRDAAPELLEALRDIVVRGQGGWAAKIAAGAIGKATSPTPQRHADILSAEVKGGRLWL